MAATRVGTSNPGGHKTRSENTAKVARHASRVRAVADLHPAVPREHQSHLIPVRQLDVDDDELRYIGQLLAGVEDFKVLRGSVAVVSLTTSMEFAHLLTDAAMISRGNVLVVELYQVKREYVFGDDDDAEADDAEQEG